MAPEQWEATFFVEEPPEFEYRDGLFRITQVVGSIRVERVMSPHVYMRAVRRAVECARQHKFGGAEVIEFPKQSDVAGH